MRKVFFILFLLVSRQAAAQWQNGTPSTNIYYSAGYVGIGTNTPTYNLDVNGFIHSRHFVSDVTTAGDVGGWFRGASTGSANVVMQGGAGGWQAYWLSAANGVFKLGGNGGTEPAQGAINIDYTGNVGIGTATPQGKLDLKGKFYLNRPAGLIDQASVIGIPSGGYLAFAPSDMSPSNNSYMLFSFPTSTTFRIGTDYDGNINQGTLRDIELGTNFTAPTLVVKREGNVGIGTTSPGSFKLAVEGKIGAREVKVTLASWADYVFNKDYKLMNLASLEAFIKKNNHLPNIPSAEEIKESGGIELGEMNRKLLEKIEELTLYVIELKKENEAIKEEVKKLAARQQTGKQ